MVLKKCCLINRQGLVAAFFGDAGDGIVFRIDEDDVWGVFGQLRFVDVGEGGDDDQIVRVGVVGGGAVDLDGA